MKKILGFLLPLLLIPLTLYSVLLFGQIAGTVIIGLAFLIGIAKFADKKERKFMIILAVFSSLFENLNVALGSYQYLGVAEAPIWVGLGWGILGLYLIKHQKLLAKVPNNITYALACGLYLVIWGMSGFSLAALIPSIFGVLTIYVLTLSSNLPSSFFLSASALGMLIEFSGTSFGIWTYFDQLGLPIPPPLASLGLAYASVLTFALWLSGMD